jgi:hypothetical protein
MNIIKKLFKKKLKGELEKAEDQGLITHEELLRLKLDRASRELDKHLKDSEPKKKK